MSLLQVSFSPSNTPRLYSKRSSRRQRGSVLEVFHACSQRLLVVTSQWWRGDQFLGENCSSSSFPQLKLLFSLPSAQRWNIPFCRAMPSNYFNENMYVYIWPKTPIKLLLAAPLSRGSQPQQLALHIWVLLSPCCPENPNKRQIRYCTDLHLIHHLSIFGTWFVNQSTWYYTKAA